jgi:hypothetical protein
LSIGLRCGRPDACTDETAKIARETIGAFGEVLQVAARSTQKAHCVGLSTVMEHFRRVPRHALLLCSADADSILCRDWISTRLESRHLTVLERSPKSAGASAALTCSNLLVAHRNQQLGPLFAD